MIAAALTSRKDERGYRHGNRRRAIVDDTMEFVAELSVDIANRIPEITALAHRVERFLHGFDVPHHTIFQINLALDELLTNAITYGYRDDGPHRIRVAVGIGAGAIDVRIEDDAAEFDPFARDSVDTAAPLDERNPGGLGIHLVKEMLDRVDYRRIDGRNRITLRQSFAADSDSAAPDSAAPDSAAEERS
jgi:anti-sigma regulatory factor (Ser/Thr protein kinase)